jgi:hypothetical protein
MESPAAPARTTASLPDRAITAIAAHWFGILFVGGILANLAPLVVTSVLPMSDVDGLEGIIGVLRHRHDPAVHTERYFDVHIVPPNAFSYGFVLLLSHLMPITAATNLFVALFAVLALPLALHFTLRACGKDPRLALFGVAATYHRSLWYGLLGSVAGAALLILQIGLMNAAFSRPRTSWRDVALAGTLLLLATSHAFLFAVGAALFALWILLALGQPSRPLRRCWAILPSFAYFGPWVRHLASGGSGSSLAGFVRDLWNLRQPLRAYVVNIHDWFLDAYASGIDEAVALLFAATLVALLAFGIRDQTSVSSPQATAPRAPASGRAWSWRLPVTVAFFTVGYFGLPMSIRHPFGWWGVHVRLLVPAILGTVLLIPRRARGLPAWVLAPVGLGAIVYGLFIANDFRTWWVPVELAGLHEAIAQIPPGQRVHAIYPRMSDEHHYSHFPMGHIVDQYLVEKGGNATPAMSSHPSEHWAGWKPVPAAPWGESTQFSWRQHAGPWNYFLVKEPAPGNGAAFRPFRDAPAGAVTKIFERGLWSVWQKPEP